MTERRWIALCLLLGLGLFLGSLVAATCLAQGIASSPYATLAPGAPVSPSPTPVLVTPQPAVAQHDGHVTLAQSLTGTLPYTPPQLVANTGLTLPLGDTRVIGPAQLRVTDAESGPEAITYTLRAAPSHGALLLDGITLTVGATFTQAAIDAARLRYAHDGALAPRDSFVFSAISAADAGEPIARASVSSAGEQGNGHFFFYESPALSADGRFVAFASVASNLVRGDTNGTLDVFVRDRLSGQTTRVSLSSTGEQGDRSYSPALSADGRLVAFTSYASNLVPGDTNETWDVFVHDRLTGQTTRISLSSTGEQGNGWSYLSALSADGRYVAFVSQASNLVPDDTNGVTDVFVHDRLTGQTTRVSVNSAGEQGNRESTSPALSADGRYVAFYSYASNLTPGDTNGYADVFVRDRLTGQTTRVSVNSAGGQGNDWSYSPALSADGRFVAFTSYASNLVSGDTNGTADAFVRDRLTGQTTRVSLNSTGDQGNGWSFSSALSANGRFVAFLSYASNLVPGDTNGVTDVFVHDRLTGQTTRVSVNSAGEQGNRESTSPALSADGRYVAFYSYASNLTPGDTNGYADVFVRDRLTGQTTRVSVNSAGGQGNDWSYSPALSADGRFVAFTSYASNLVSGDTNGTADAFVRDRLTGQTTRVSLNSTGDQGNGWSFSSALSANGRFVAFLSYASNLVPGDTNGTADVFVRDRLSGQTTRVSVSSAGEQGNDWSYPSALSADGRFVAFYSDASNLVPGDSNGTADVFVRDRGVILAAFPIRLALPDVTLNKAASAGLITPGQPITYTLSFGNTWISTATGVLLTDVVPSIVTGLSYTSSGAAVTPLPGSRYAWQVQDLAPGAGGVITLTGIVSPALTGAAALINTAMIACALDAEAANNTACTLVWLADTPPQLAANTGITLPLGAARVIGPAQLRVTDAESGPEAITYTLRAGPAHGALLLDGVPLTVGATFTQAAIDAARLRYAHDGALAPRDSFTFSATDAGEPMARVSVNSAGDQGNGASGSSALSADGRFVAFASVASNLVRGDTNGNEDIFVHDRLSGQTTRISVNSAGEQGNDGSYSTALSADGRFVAFASTASNLVPSDSNGARDVFVHDRLTGQTTRVSVDSTGDQGNGDSYSPALSADGRFVAFGSSASNLAPGDTNGYGDIFVHDRLTGQTARVSLSSTGDQGNVDSYSPALSADGRYVAFWSGASNLVRGDTNGNEDIFVHDRLTGQTTRVSLSSTGDQGDRSYSPALSADGRLVAFTSYASNLVPGDTNGAPDVFVHDRLTGQTTRISLSSAGEQGNDWSYSPALSADGRYVAFPSYASNLVPGDTNGAWDVFVHDRLTGQTTRVSVNSAGEQGNGHSSYYSSPALSADGRLVAFESVASNLVSGDSNGTADVFVRDRGVLLAAFALRVTPPTGEFLSVGPGRSVSTSDGALTLSVPPASSSGVTDVYYAPQPAPSQATGSLRFAGTCFRLLGLDALGNPALSPSLPITLLLRYDPTTLPPGMREDELEVCRYDEALGAWAPLVLVYRDPAAHAITVLLDHFSEFALLGPAPGAYRIGLLSGWNLISLPLAPANTAITQALSSIAGRYDLVYAYDAASASPWKRYNTAAPAFLSTLKVVSETQGLWIRADSTVSLTITGALPVSPAIALKQGWNLVGYPSQTTRPLTEALASIAGQYDLVYAYDPASARPWKKYNVAAPPFLNTLKEMDPGWGYWIRAKEDCVWQAP